MGIVLVAVLGGFMSRIVGPLFLVPVIAVAATAYRSLYPGLNRAAVLAVGCVPVAIPLGLEWAGLIPRSYVIEHGSMRILPQMVNFAPYTTELFLLAWSLAIILAIGAAATKVRKQLSDYEDRQTMQAWQLERLIPEDVVLGVRADTEPR